MNHVYRLVWNIARQCWQAVAEVARSHGQAGSAATPLALAPLALTLFGAVTHAQVVGTLPTGGNVVAGSGSIATAGSTMTVTQSTARLAIDWQSFSIGAGNTVQFVQPSASAVALNRVIGSDVSVIQGALKANGQVFLLNPNGILFSPTAQVDVGGIVASTLAVSNADFLAGNYTFAGTNSNAIINQGNITAVGNQDGGGTVALIAAQITNTGTLTAERGQVLLAAGSKVTLDLGGPVKLKVEQGAIDALIANGGAIRADGGQILLTAQAVGELTSTVINNTGVIEARTLVTGEQGQILLLGGMDKDRIEVGGTLDASAPRGGNGGFIETSAAYVETRTDLRVNAGAAQGQGGSWLIDPYDYTINAAAAGTIAAALNSDTSVTVTTATSNASYGGSATTGSGDITVASAITKSSGGEATLTLRADRNIVVNSDIGASAGKLNITLSAANAASATTGGVNINANLSANGGNILIGGGAGTSTNGIGYALNLDASNAAVVVQQNRSITSSGGDITINGRSLLSAGGSYSSVKGGVYVKSGATILSGNGDLFITGESSNGLKNFGFGVEANSNTLTRIGTGSGTGRMVLNGVNSGGDDGALGLINNGSYDRLHFVAPSVAHLVIKVNGSTKTVGYTYSPPNSGCGAVYPNCGYLQVPGANNSYLYAAYDVVNMATLPLYVAISAGSGGKVYDGNTDATGISLSALGGPVGFNVSSLGSVSFSTPSKNAATYFKLNSSGLNPTTYTSGGSSYAVSYYLSGSYAITPKALTPTAANKVYDGTTAATLTASGLLGGDVVNFNYTSGSFSDKDVGNGKTVTATGVSLSGTDAGNYSLGSTTVNATANITPKEIAVGGLTASNKVYDASTSATIAGTPVFNYAAPGAGTSSDQKAYTGDTLTLNVGAVSASFANKNVDNGKAVSVSGYSLSGADAGNYTLVQPSGLTANITPAQLTINGLSANNKVYDGTSNATLSGTASLAGLIGSDTVNLSGSASSGTFADPNAGSGKAVTASLGGLSLSGADASNYQIAGVTSPLSANITAAALSVTANNASKTYDGQAYSGGNGVSYSGFVNNESSSVLGGSLAYGGSSQGAVNAGSYTLTPSGLSSSNYSISYTNGALTVNPATLTITANAASRTYGSANPAFSGTVTGFVAGQNAANALGGSLAFSTSATQSSNVGSYGLTGSGLTANNGNYVFVQAAGNASALTITPAALSVTANNASKTYDGQAYSGGNGVSYSGFVNNESSSVLGGSLAYGGSSQGAVNAGSYTLTPSGLSSSNYSISYTNGALTIAGGAATPAPAPVAVAEVKPEPQQYMPKAALVPQFADANIDLRPSTKPLGTPDGLNYVFVGNTPASNAVAAAADIGGNAPIADGGSKRPTEEGIGSSYLPRSTLGPTNVFVLNGGVNTTPFVNLSQRNGNE
jgi:filamentous hemagglutinin family protein